MKKWFKISSSRTVIRTIRSSVESPARAPDTKFRSSVPGRKWDWTLERPMHTFNIFRPAKEILKVDESRSSARMAARAEEQNL
ncbi:hypothetical protein CsSME_00029979 [Camellia sinensis var. sinensis]